MSLIKRKANKDYYKYLESEDRKKFLELLFENSDLESALYLWEQISAPRNTASKRTSRVFTCFPKLPTEIRLAIWDLASRTTRNLDVMQNIQGQECRYYYVRYSSKAPVPSILHTSHESRMAALKHYTLAFPFIVSPGVASKETKTSGIYVNWEYDCICPMNLENIPDHFRFAQKLSGIRKIALNVDLINVRAISIYCIDTVDEIILYPGRSFYEDVYSDNLRCLFPVMDIQFAGLAINGGDIPQSSTSLWALRELEVMVEAGKKLAAAASRKNLSIKVTFRRLKYNGELIPMSVSPDI